MKTNQRNKEDLSKISGSTTLGDEYLSVFNEQYGLLVPQHFDGLLLLSLKQKIYNKDIGEKFTRSDFENTIRDVAIFLLESKIPQTELTLKKLQYFIETSRKDYKLSLTPYAEKFISLIENKIDNQYKNFPLKTTFQNLFTIQSDQIITFIELNSWYTQQFSNTSKETVLAHIDSLQDEVDRSIGELKGILKLIQQAKENQVLEKIKAFAEVFENLGDKAHQLSEALELKNETINELEKVIKNFQLATESFKHPENREEQERFNELKENWDKGLEIQKKVENFFYSIDGKLRNNLERIVYASNKLGELSQNLKFHSRLKINLRKLMTVLLSQSQTEKEGYKLPDAISTKSMPFERVRLVHVPYYKFFVKKKIIDAVEFDEEYLSKEREKVEIQNKIQERTSIVLKKMKKILDEKNEINYDNHFFEVLKNEENIEVALHVGYELMRYAALEKWLNLKIEKELVKSSDATNIYVWKMRINKDMIS